MESTTASCFKQAVSDQLPYVLGLEHMLANVSPNVKVLAISQSTDAHTGVTRALLEEQLVSAPFRNVFHTGLHCRVHAGATTTTQQPCAAARRRGTRLPRAGPRAAHRSNARA